MRKLVYLIILFPSLIFSQTVGFKYQAVVRNANGDLLVNQQVSFKTTILSGSAIGTEIYSETHTVGTNGYGVVNLNIGNGTAVSGSYSNIDWSSSTHFLKTELDITGGSSYQFMGTSQILSVPYSEYAEMSGSSMVDNDTSATNEIQQLSLVGNQLVLSNGGSVTLTGTVDLDADPSNELQSLSLSNDTLYLSQGNNVVLPPDSDGDATNELQALSLSSDTLYLTSGGYVVLPPDSDGDVTNEIQVLSLSNDTLYLTSGGYVVLPPDSDGDATNEIQALSLSNDTLYLTNGGYAVLPPDNDGDATNEIQALTNTAGTISITNGNTITLEDSSAINEIQVLSISNDTLYLTNGGFAVLPDELDSDTTNEIQTLSYSNDTLSISGGNNVTINSSNFDFIYPDGKTGITPISFSTTGVGSYAVAAWPFVEASLNVNYQVPSGKNLYITSISSGASISISFWPEILINNKTIFRSFANWSNVTYSRSVYFKSPYHPIILNSGDSLKIKPPVQGSWNNTNYTVQSHSVSGFLVDKKVNALTIDVYPNNNYTVPQDMILVVLNICGEGQLNSGGQIYNLSPMNWMKSVSTGGGNYYYVPQSMLNSPIFIDENNIISGTGSVNTPMTINGYLIDK